MNQELTDGQGMQTDSVSQRFRQIEARIEARKRRIADFISMHGTATFGAPLRALANAYAIVSPSAHTPGKWQGTVFDDLGPRSDIVRDDYSTVLNEFVMDFNMDLDSAQFANAICT